MKSQKGHSKKIKKKFCKINLRKFSFTNRIVDLWNTLPQWGRLITPTVITSTVISPTVITPKLINTPTMHPGLYHHILSNRNSKQL